MLDHSLFHVLYIRIIIELFAIFSIGIQWSLILIEIPTYTMKGAAITCAGSPCITRRYLHITRSDSSRNSYISTRKHPAAPQSYILRSTLVPCRVSSRYHHISHFTSNRGAFVRLKTNLSTTFLEFVCMAPDFLNFSPNFRPDLL